MQTVVTAEGSNVSTIGQYLSFKLGGEEYAVEILRVREIRCWEKVTSLPNAPRYVTGIINIRGSIIPVVDLRVWFGVQVGVEHSRNPVVVVLQVEHPSKTRVMGIVVDAVSEVLEIDKTQIRKGEDFGGAITNDSILGIFDNNNQMVILLNIDHLLCCGALSPV